MLDTIDQLGLPDNTLVIFTTDNGPWSNAKEGLAKKHNGQIAWGSSGPLREAKGSTYEGGLRVPCIASLTKLHTSTVLVMLAEQGHLSLDEPVDKYLPEFANLRVRGKDEGVAAPTLRQCLSHTAGFAGNNALKAGKFELNLDGSLADVVADLATKELLAEPGKKHAYSRLGYITAGRVAEIVTGRPFPQLMTKMLAQPTRGNSLQDIRTASSRPLVPSIRNVTLLIATSE